MLYGSESIIILCPNRKFNFSADVF